MAQDKFMDLLNNNNFKSTSTSSKLDTVHPTTNNRHVEDDSIRSIDYSLWNRYLN